MMWSIEANPSYLYLCHGPRFLAVGLTATSKMGWPFWFQVQQTARQEGRGHGGMGQRMEVLSQGW